MKQSERGEHLFGKQQEDQDQSVMVDGGDQQLEMKDQTSARLEQALLDDKNTSASEIEEKWQ